MTHVPIKGEETQRHTSSEQGWYEDKKDECHIMIEANLGMMQPQAQEFQGLQATTRVRKLQRRGRILSRVPEGHLGFRFLASKTMRRELSVKSLNLGYFLKQS